MSESVYAINRSSSPPATWIMQWTASGTVDVIMPPGFVEVTEPEYNQATQAQQRAADRSMAQAEHAYRVTLSDQRKALVNTGMTYEQVCILVPDSVDDYTIDDGWRS